MNTTNPPSSGADRASPEVEVRRDGKRAPRLPHERDLSTDSQAPRDGTPPPEGRQGLKDLQQGRQDTSKAPEADRAYRKLKQGR